MLGLPALANTPSFYGVLQFEPGILLHTCWASTLPTALRATPLALKTLKNLKVHPQRGRQKKQEGRRTCGHGLADRFSRELGRTVCFWQWDKGEMTECTGFPVSSFLLTQFCEKGKQQGSVDWRALSTAEDETILQNHFTHPSQHVSH